jgi:hypothetical protein
MSRSRALRALFRKSATGGGLHSGLKWALAGRCPGGVAARDDPCSALTSNDVGGRASVPPRGVLEVRADMAALISFYEWLTKQKSLRTSLGGFARDLARDAGFPRDVASLEA